MILADIYQIQTANLPPGGDRWVAIPDGSSYR